MKPRLGLAVAHLQPLDLLILDEPTNRLAPPGVREIGKFVQRGTLDEVLAHRRYRRCPVAHARRRHLRDDRPVRARPGGLFISTQTENAIAAMATTVSTAVFSALLEGVPQLSGIHPALLTDHWLGYDELLRTSISGSDLAQWTALHLAYAAIFLSLAWSRMTTKDITS